MTEKPRAADPGAPGRRRVAPDAGAAGEEPRSSSATSARSARDRAAGAPPTRRPTRRPKGRSRRPRPTSTRSTAEAEVAGRRWSTPRPSRPRSRAPAAPLGAELESLRAELDERTRDLQRVSAEYANYRKRVDRDRGLVAEQATGSVLAALLPILDDLDRAREHGDLVGPFGTWPSSSPRRWASSA